MGFAFLAVKVLGPFNLILAEEFLKGAIINLQALQVVLLLSCQQTIWVRLAARVLSDLAARPVETLVRLRQVSVYLAFEGVESVEAALGGLDNFCRQFFALRKLLGAAHLYHPH